MRPLRRQAEELMSATIETTLGQAVEDAAAELYVWSLKDIPTDLRDALGDALEHETHPVGKRILETIHTNVEVADEGKRLVCQDTGIAVYYVRVGENFPLHPVRIEEALREGTRRATLDHPLRSNTVHTLTRKPTGDNTGHRIPHVHWEFVPDWDGLDIKCVPKGSGSENMSFLKMLVPGGRREGDQGVRARLGRRRRREAVPAGIVGVGIGGSADLAMHLAKEAIARPVGNAQPGSRRRRSRARPLRPPERDRRRPDGSRRRHDGALGARRAGPHAHHAQPRRRELPVLGRPPGDGARLGRRRDRAGQGRVVAHHEITFPTDEATVRSFEAGDTVTIQGHIIGIRDATQIRIFDQGQEPPMSLEGAALLHTAPNVRKLEDGRYEPLSIGTTTSARMSRFTEPLIRDHGARAIMGKGGLLPEALGPLAEHGGVYLAIVGGAAALQTTQIVEIEQVEWEDLMPECLWRFRVADFGPLIVAMDSHGKSLYEDVQVEARRRIAESLAAKL